MPNDKCENVLQWHIFMWRSGVAPIYYSCPSAVSHLSFGSCLEPWLLTLVCFTYTLSAGTCLMCVYTFVCVFMCVYVCAKWHRKGFNWALPPSTCVPVSIPVSPIFLAACTPCTRGGCIQWLAMALPRDRALCLVTYHYKTRNFKQELYVVSSCSLQKNVIG